MKKKNKNRKGKKKMSTEKRVIVNDQTGKAKPIPHAPVPRDKSMDHFGSAVNPTPGIPEAVINKARPGRILPDEIRLGADQQTDYVLDPAKDLPALSGAGPQDPVEAQIEANKLAEDLDKIRNMDLGKAIVNTMAVQPLSIQPDPIAAMKVQVATMTDEQKLALAKELGLPVGGKAKKEKGTVKEFNKAVQCLCRYLFEESTDFQNCIGGACFPGPFSFTFGVDHAGFFFANIKRLRKEYEPRKKATEEELTALGNLSSQD